MVSCITAEEPPQGDAERKGGEDFDPSQCLFCSRASSSLDESLVHMGKMHGMFIPDKYRLVVDVETLVKYLHLVISVYFECLHCGTRRSSAQAAKQHMVAKAHCRFDITDEDSDVRDFYNFSSCEQNTDDEVAGLPVAQWTPLSVQPGETSLRLPSGKILSHRFPRMPRQHCLNRLEATSPELDLIPSSSTHTISNTPTNAEARNLASTGQLATLRAHDRRSLMHLPISQQRSLLTTQKKEADKARRTEQASEARVSRKGNKTLMKHFVADVPGRKNG